MQASRLAAGLSCLALIVAGSGIAAGAGASTKSELTTVAHATHCPWLRASLHHESSPAKLAAEVVGKMTLAEKLGFLVLEPSDGYENANVPVPSLCIGRLTLQDGPDGIAYDAPGVTQLPSAIGLAASFDPLLAYDDGEVLGQEARAKGIDVLQGPNLNLLRVPTSGRAFEGLGEDPYLVSTIGDAMIEGIQSEHVIAQAKHLGVYTQETARVVLNQVVSARALNELYLAPFAEAVQDAHVGSVMCAYGSINGVNTCSDSILYKDLRSWGFTGFVRSDLSSVTNAVGAFNAGLDLIKPYSVAALTRLVELHEVSLRRIDDAVQVTLAVMFRFGLIAHPLRGTMRTTVTSPAHAAFAVTAAERSMVLLKDDDAVLPLAATRSSVAVIGAAGGAHPLTTGLGSAHVRSKADVSPFVALRRSLPHGTRVSYSVGGPSTSLLAPIPADDFVAGSPLPVRARPLAPAQQGTADLGVERSPTVTRSIATATRPGRGPQWSRWSATVAAPATGLYAISLTDDGDTWLTLDGVPLLSSPGIHGRSSWSVAVELIRGRHYRLSAAWFSADGTLGPRIGWDDASPAIGAAVATARHAHVAVVFASAREGEGSDRPTLELPGVQDALIAAVAAANPRTIVVLDTGGAVLMPWLSHVAAVVEAWYAGQGDATATAAVLTGRVDPSGRLPISFPARNDQTLPALPADYPGIDGTVEVNDPRSARASSTPANSTPAGSSEGLDIGYRYLLAHDETPLFPFGFGLSYTTFALSDPRLATSELSSASSGEQLSVLVHNTGQRRGTEVVEAYLAYPSSADEPPEQLRAFNSVTLAPGASARVVLDIPRSSFEAYLGGRFVVPSGTFTLSIGTSSTDLPISFSIGVPEIGTSQPTK